MGAVDREHLELIAFHAANPARNLGRFAIPCFLERVYILRQSRLIFWIVSQRAEGYPVKPGEATGGRQYVAENRYCEKRNSYCVNGYSKTKQKIAPCSLFSVHINCSEPAPARDVS